MPFSQVVGGQLTSHSASGCVEGLFKLQPSVDLLILVSFSGHLDLDFSGFMKHCPDQFVPICTISREFLKETW